MNKAIRYTMVQCCAYIIDIGTFAIIVSTGISSALVSNIVAKFAAGTFAFFSHRHITFGAGGEHILAQMLRYIGVLTINSIVGSTLLAATLMTLSSAIAAKIIADVMLFVISFFISRNFIFRRTSLADREGKR